MYCCYIVERSKGFGNDCNALIIAVQQNYFDVATLFFLLEQVLDDQFMLRKCRVDKYQFNAGSGIAGVFDKTDRAIVICQSRSDFAIKGIGWGQPNNIRRKQRSWLERFQVRMIDELVLF